MPLSILDHRFRFPSPDHAAAEGLVAIGGDFRIPSILAKSGASLREVGTTNRTTAADYREALPQQNLVPLWPSLRAVLPPGKAQESPPPLRPKITLPELARPRFAGPL